MRRNRSLVLLVFAMFFVVSFITNILGPLVPDIIVGFHLSLALAGFLPFSFFIAYGVMSIPGGMLLERFGAKPVMLAAFALAFCGSFLFAVVPSFPVALVSLFTIGIGMTLLQVTINPLLRAAGGEEHFAFLSVLGQLVFGAASFASPYTYSYLVTRLRPGAVSGGWLDNVLASVVPPALPWISLYFFVVVTALVIVSLTLTRLPQVALTDGERPGAYATHRRLLSQPVVLFYFFGIFAYVGTEQGVANWVSQFLQEYHRLDPQVGGARVVAHFWGLMTVGCVLGLLLLKLFDCRRVLAAFVVAAMACLAVALWSPDALVSAHAFRMLGFCLSVMWSIVFSLALNSLAEHHGSFSGILCTGIIGGAIVPLLVGAVGKAAGLRAGLHLAFLSLAYLLVIALRARPLVDNETMTFGQLLQAVGEALRLRRPRTPAPR